MRVRSLITRKSARISAILRLGSSRFALPSARACGIAARQLSEGPPQWLRRETIRRQAAQPTCSFCRINSSLPFFCASVSASCCAFTLASTALRCSPIACARASLRLSCSLSLE